MTHRITRRSYLKSTAAAATAFTILPAGLARGYAANEKLNLGIIGAGGRGGANLQAVAGENIAALCDVDRGPLNAAARRFPDAKTYTDFRELLSEAKGLDAVVVSTPDHCHAPASVMAMKQGLHCYCEKPLTHSVHEARVMAQVATEKNLITHMGTGAQSSEASIRTVEAIRAGHIGDVVEAHCWTDRPIGWWAQGMERPAGEDPVPDHIDWDLFIGPAPMRPFKAAWPEDHPARKKWRHPQVYHPFVWRGWWDFGTGAIGDIAPHVMNVVFWALELGPPSGVEVVDTSGMMPEMFPEWSIVRYDFPAREGRPPFKLFWYDGKKTPPAELLAGSSGGNPLFVGTKGSIRVGGTPYPAKEFSDYEWPEPTLPRRGEIHAEWIKGIKNGTQTGCPFSYAGPMTEAYLLGNIALRVGQRIEWDATASRVTNCEEANPYLHREYRDGWSL